MAARKGSLLREMAHSTFRRRAESSHHQQRQSLVQTIGTRLRQSLGGIDRFERSLIREAEDLDLDGVICGHSHQPADSVINGRRYLNCGDWIVNCSAVFEDNAGNIFSRHISSRSSAVTRTRHNTAYTSPHDYEPALSGSINP